MILASRLILLSAQVLVSARELASFNRPQDRDYSSVKSYFDEESPLCNDESYIYRREDIVTLKPGRENAWLDAFVEKTLQTLSCRLIKVSVTCNVSCKMLLTSHGALVLLSGMLWSQKISLTTFY